MLITDLNSTDKYGSDSGKKNLISWQVSIQGNRFVISQKQVEDISLLYHSKFQNRYHWLV